jgi:hypothetical protein
MRLSIGNKRQTLHQYRRQQNERAGAVNSVRVGAAIVVALVAIAGLGACESAPPKPTPHPVVATMKCPAQPFKLAPSKLAGASTKLVPFTPTSALICRYGVLPSRALEAGVLVDTAQLAAFTARLNHAIKVVPKGQTYYCPFDNDAVIDVYLSSATQRIQVSRELAGCRFISNGSVNGFFVGPDDPTGFLGIPTTDGQHL